MNESFAIQGFSASNQMLCMIEGSDIYQTDYMGNKRLLGKTSAAYAELEQTTAEYYDKLVELGVIVPPVEPEQMMAQMQQSMLQMSQIIKGLSDEVKELKKNGSEHHCKCGDKDVPQRKPTGGSEKSTAGAERDSGLSGGSGSSGEKAGS